MLKLLFKIEEEFFLRVLLQFKVVFMFGHILLIKGSSSLTVWCAVKTPVTYSLSLYPFYLSAK